MQAVLPHPIKITCTLGGLKLLTVRNAGFWGTAVMEAAGSPETFVNLYQTTRRQTHHARIIQKGC